MSAEIARLREARLADDLIRPIPSWEFERPPPQRQFLVPGVFPLAVVSMVSGDPSIGKSLLLQQMLTAAVMGREWLGLPCERGNGLLLSCEDDAIELLNRQRAIERHMGIEHADLENGLHLIDRVGGENALATLNRATWRMTPTPLFLGLGRWCAQHGIRYVVVDTRNATYAGPMNDPRCASDFVSILRRLAIAIQGAVILTDHPSLSGRATGTGEAGSVQWNAAVRSRLYMRSEGDSTVLSGMKANYSRKLEKIRLKWSRGVFIVDAPEPVRHWLDRED